MNAWGLALLTGAAVAMALTWHTPRAWLWICLGGLSFLASSLQWEYGDKSLHPLFAFTCDALFCLAMHLWARSLWEVPVLFLFVVSVFVNLVKLGGFIPEGGIHAALLEIINWLALLWVTSVGIIDLVHRYEFNRVHSMWLRLHSPRHSLS